MTTPSTGSPRTLALALLLFGLGLALYWPTRDFAFLNYDDDVYVTANAGVRGGPTPAGVRWAFTTGHAANWHPVTWLSHQLDVACFGLDAGAHHRTNAVLHGLAMALLFLALLALSGARGASALVAAFFGLHPLRVESVAWIAERKDLLAGVFGFACLGAWAGWVKRGGALRYGASLGAFALALLAKPMMVTLPAILLVLDGWPLRRLGTSARTAWGRVREKLPFFALAAASSFVTLRVQTAGGALGPFETIGLGPRLANALGSTATYAWKTIWPSGSSVFHPHPVLARPPRGPWTPSVFLALAFLLGTTWLLVRLRRRAPFALAGWLWFLGTLVPMCGLVQVGLQGWAERYSYLPSIGLGILLVFTGRSLATSVFARRLATTLAVAGLAALTWTSHAWLAHWRDSRALFEQALRVEESSVAHVNLGRALEELGDLARAETHYTRALDFPPVPSGARVNLARVLRAQGRSEEARLVLESALLAEPNSFLAHGELGWLLAEAGRDAEGLPHLRRALELAPGRPALQNNLAWVLATSPTDAAPEEARVLAAELCERTHGQQAGYLETLAAALARLGRNDEAAQVQEQVLRRVSREHRARQAERLERYRAGQPFVRPNSPRPGP